MSGPQVGCGCALEHWQPVGPWDPGCALSDVLGYALALGDCRDGCLGESLAVYHGGRLGESLAVNHGERLAWHLVG